MVHAEPPLFTIDTDMASPGCTVQVGSPLHPEVIGVSDAGRISYHA